MSITIFSKKNGFVRSFMDPALPARTTLKVEDWGGFVGFRSIITSVTVSAQGNFQFLHTLGGSIYIYVFGDRIGQLSISGLAFDSVCDGGNGSSIGIERVLNYYKGHRVAARKDPIKVTIGASTTMRGYLVGVAGGVQDPKSQIYQFTLQMLVAPHSGKKCSTGGGSSSGGGGGVGGGGGGGGGGAPTPPKRFSYLDTAAAIARDGAYSGDSSLVLLDAGAGVDGYDNRGSGPAGEI